MVKFVETIKNQDYRKAALEIAGFLLVFILFLLVSGAFSP
jgi:hypothetical protein